MQLTRMYFCVPNKMTIKEIAIGFFEYVKYIRENLVFEHILKVIAVVLLVRKKYDRSDDKFSCVKEVQVLMIDV